MIEVSCHPVLKVVKTLTTNDIINCLYPLERMRTLFKDKFCFILESLENVRLNFHPQLHMT